MKADGPDLISDQYQGVNDQRGRGGCQIITLDHKGGGRVQRGPKMGHLILEVPQIIMS